MGAVTYYIYQPNNRNVNHEGVEITPTSVQLDWCYFLTPYDVNFDSLQYLYVTTPLV